MALAMCSVQACGYSLARCVAVYASLTLIVMDVPGAVLIAFLAFMDVRVHLCADSQDIQIVHRENV